MEIWHFRKGLVLRSMNFYKVNVVEWSHPDWAVQHHQHSETSFMSPSQSNPPKGNCLPLFSLASTDDLRMGELRIVYFGSWYWSLRNSRAPRWGPCAASPHGRKQKGKRAWAEWGGHRHCLTSKNWDGENEANSFQKALVPPILTTS
jgi:hypothetical protein